MSSATRRLILGAVLVVAAVALATRMSLVDGLQDGLGWARDAGPAGVAAFSAVYAVAVVAMVPGSWLTLGAGLTWGPVGGFIAVWPGAVVGATVAFVLARTVARERVQGWLASDARLASLDRAVGGRGLGMVGLLRLSPVVPFGLLNYALGATAVRGRDYVVATAVGIIPGTFLYAYLGSTAGSLAQLGEASGQTTTAGRLLYWGGLLATLGVTLWVTRLAREALAGRLDGPSHPTAEDA